MADDHDDLYFDDSNDTHDGHDLNLGSRATSFDDTRHEREDASDLNPSDSASQVGRAITTDGDDSSSSPRIDSPSSGHQFADSLVGSASFCSFPTLKNET